MLLSTPNVKLLEWDTEFWGFRTVSITTATLTQEEMTDIDRWCIEQQVRCLYFLCNLDHSESTRIAENNGFNFADIRMTFERNIADVTNFNLSAESDTLVRECRPDDLPVLENIARTIHDNTRFTYDPKFPKALTGKMYETWIRNSVVDETTLVLVCDYGDTPAGYITCHVNRETLTGQIGLLGVDSSVRGKGIGQLLVFHAINWCASQQLAKMLVVTQGSNYASQRLYQRCGFLTAAVQLWYHKWYD